MKQEDFEKYLEDYLNDSLEGEALREFERALAADPALRKEADAQKKLTAMLRQVEPPKAPVSLRANIMKELRAEARQAAAQQAAAQQTAEQRAARQDAFFRPAPQKISLWDRLAALLPQWRFQMAVALAFIAGIAVTYALVRPGMQNEMLPGATKAADNQNGNNGTDLAESAKPSTQDQMIAMASPKSSEPSQPETASAPMQDKLIVSAEGATSGKQAAKRPTPDRDLIEGPAENSARASSTPSAPGQPGRLADLGGIKSSPEQDTKRENIVVADAQKERATAPDGGMAAAKTQPKMTEEDESAMDAAPIEEPQWPGETETYRPGQMADATPPERESTQRFREDRDRPEPGDTQQMQRSFQPAEQQRPRQEAPAPSREPSRLMGDIAKIAGNILAPNAPNGSNIPMSRQSIAHSSNENRVDSRPPDTRSSRNNREEWRGAPASADSERIRRQERGDMGAIPEPQAMADAREEESSSSRGGYTNREEIDPSRRNGRDGLDISMRQGFQPAPFEYRKPRQDRRAIEPPAAAAIPESPAEIADNFRPRPARIVPTQENAPRSSPAIVSIITNGVTVGEIQSHLQAKGIDIRRARTQDGGSITSSLACSAPGRDLSWLMRQLRELGIEQDSSLNNRSIGSARSMASRKLAQGPEKKGLAFVSSGRRPAKDQTFEFHLNIVNIRDR